MHSRGIVHRLEAQNVLVTRSAAKLADMGLAKRLGAAGSDVSPEHLAVGGAIGRLGTAGVRRLSACSGQTGRSVDTFARVPDAYCLTGASTRSVKT